MPAQIIAPQALTPLQTPGVTTPITLVTTASPTPLTVDGVLYPSNSKLFLKTGAAAVVATFKATKPYPGGTTINLVVDLVANKEYVFDAPGAFFTTAQGRVEVSFSNVTNLSVAALG